MNFEFSNIFGQTAKFLKDAWQQGVFGSGYSQILLALAIIAITLLLRNFVAKWLLRLVESATRVARVNVDKRFLNVLLGPIKLLVFIVGLDIALRSLSVDPSTRVFTDRLVRSLIAITVFWSLSKIIAESRRLLGPLERMLTAAAVDWLIKSMQILFLIIGAAAVLETWGIKVGPLLAGLGIFGVAIALGAQDLFKNLIAGLAVLAEKRFETGDWVLVEDVVEGTVEQINFRSTVIQRFDKGPVYVPNSKLADNALTNFSRMSHRRIFWKVGLEYATSAVQLRKIRDRIERYLEDDDAYAKPPEVSLFVRVDQFSDSAIELLIYCFTRTTVWGEWLRIKEQLLLEIKTIVEEEGASFAFPSRKIYFGDGDVGPQGL